MKIAIDISPISSNSGHKVRGAGMYIEMLMNGLKKYGGEHEFIFFNKGDSISSDIDLIHYPYFELFSRSLPLLATKKRIVTVHDMTPLVFSKEFPAGIKGKLNWNFQKIALKNSSAVITDSYASQKDIQKFTSINKEKIKVVYLTAPESYKKLPTNDPKIKKFINKNNLPDRFVLYVGDVTWNKNLPRLLQATQQLDIPLVMVGKSLSEKDFDRNNAWNKDRIVVEKLSDSKNVYKLGFLSTEDLITAYNSAALLVMPSLYEGFGLPVVEAMSCGCPVVASNKGSLGEVAGDAAVIIDPESIESIKNGIKDVFENPSKRRELIKKGDEQASKFSLKKTALDTVKVYSSVLNS